MTVSYNSWEITPHHRDADPYPYPGFHQPLMARALVFLALALAPSAASACCPAGSAVARALLSPQARGLESRNEVSSIGVPSLAVEGFSSICSACDDEIEIPDMPDDDCPDDLGEALVPGHPTPERIVLPAMTTHREACVRWHLAPILTIERADGPRFLSLCRLLF